jgi:hypothetical protein
VSASVCLIINFYSPARTHEPMTGGLYANRLLRYVFLHSSSSEDTCFKLIYSFSFSCLTHGIPASMFLNPIFNVEFERRVRTLGKFVEFQSLSAFSVIYVIFCADLQ